MPTYNWVDEKPETFREVAGLLRNAADRLEATAEAMDRLHVEVVEVPMKGMVFDALFSINKWATAADDGILQAKVESGALGPDPRGKGPKAGRPSPGSGNFRRKKKAKK